VDWASSRAFAFGHGGIWINLAGRESRGCVPRSGYEALRAQLMAALRSWRDPGTGAPVLRAVWRWEASRSERGHDLPVPDIGFALTPGYGLERRNLVGHPGTDRELIRPNLEAWSGGHEGPYRPADVPGILVLHGPGIPAGVELREARIVDLARTLLRRLGAHPPLHLDGRSLLSQTS
jgi:predicted AlkP superfamily phosphohydrolase/phosphomutase